MQKLNLLLAKAENPLKTLAVEIQRLGTDEAIRGPESCPRKKDPAPRYRGDMDQRTGAPRPET